MRTDHVGIGLPYLAWLAQYAGWLIGLYVGVNLVFLGAPLMATVRAKWAVAAQPPNVLNDPWMMKPA